MATNLEQVIETFLNKILDIFIKGLKNGIPELGIPALDPLAIPVKKEAGIKNVAVSISTSFSDMKVVGLSSMIHPKLEIRDRRVKATTTIQLKVTGKYTLKGSAIKIVTLGGDSTFECGFESLEITIGLDFKDVNDLKVIVELKSGDVKLTLNDFECTKAVRGMVNSLVKKLSEVIAKVVEESIGPALQNGLQKLIDQHKSEIAS